MRRALTGLTAVVLLLAFDTPVEALSKATYVDQISADRGTTPRRGFGVVPFHVLSASVYALQAGIRD